MGEKTALCELKHLHTAFRIKDSYYDAVDDVDLTIYSKHIFVKTRFYRPHENLKHFAS